MIDKPYSNHRQAALALLNHRQNLSHKEAGFCGHVCVTQALSVRQSDWLTKLLIRHGMSAFAKEGGQ